jgi:hypothetical protein
LTIASKEKKESLRTDYLGLLGPTAVKNPTLSNETLTNQKELAETVKLC